MSAIDRREFLTVAAGAATAFLAAAPRLSAVAPPPAAGGLIDTNVTLGRWPFRRLPLDDTAALMAKLRSQGVTEAWAGSFDALLHKDLAAVNRRLAEECATSGGLLAPFGAINPLLPDWPDDLRRCVEEHQMRGIRLFPNYHGYTLSDPRFAAVLDAATARGLLVQISVIMEDERTLHPLVTVAATDPAPLVGLLKDRPNTRVQLLNAFRTLRGKPLTDLAATGVRFEIAMLEGVEGITKLLAQIDPDRLCFGSHAPFFYFESAALKLKESVLTTAQLRAISWDNARRILASR